MAAAVLPSSSAGTGDSSAATILYILTGELAIGAAVLSATRAWVAKEKVPAFASAGFLAFGIHELAQATSFAAPASASRITGNTCLALAFGLILISVVHGADGGRSARPAHPVNLAMAALVAALVMLAVERPAGIGILSDDGLTSRSGDLIIVGAWAALGMGAIYLGRDQASPLKIWIGFTALCLAQGSLARVVISNSQLGLVARQVLEAAAVALTLVGTTQALQRAMADNQSLVRDSMRAFEDSEARRRRDADAHEEAVHDLRSAMTTISSASHLLVSSSSTRLTDEVRSHLITALQSELERARRLLSLEWDRGRKSFTILEVLSPIVARERAQGVIIDVNVPLSMTVLGNRDRTYEVFATLFDNARRHAPGAPLTGTATAVDGTVTVAIEDRGPGLPPDTELLFQRGWSTSDRDEGRGLGLYVARRLMEEQGGRLDAANRPGGGAEFLVRLPEGDGALRDTDDIESWSLSENLPG